MTVCATAMVLDSASTAANVIVLVLIRSSLVDRHRRDDLHIHIVERHVVEPACRIPTPGIDGAKHLAADHHSSALEIDDSLFAAIDRVALARTSGASEPCD
jgi:hypothetical protein